MKTRNGKIVLLILLVCFFSPKASTELVKPKPDKSFGKKYNSSIRMDFSDELVEGEVQKPQTEFILQRKNMEFKKMIKVRQNFNQKIMNSRETLDVAK